MASTVTRGNAFHLTVSRGEERGGGGGGGGQRGHGKAGLGVVGGGGRGGGGAGRGGGGSGGGWVGGGLGCKSETESQSTFGQSSVVTIYPPETQSGAAPTLLPMTDGAPASPQPTHEDMCLAVRDAAWLLHSAAIWKAKEVDVADHMLRVLEAVGFSEEFTPNHTPWGPENGASHAASIAQACAATSIDLSPGSLWAVLAHVPSTTVKCGRPTIDVTGTVACLDLVLGAQRRALGLGKQADPRLLPLYLATIVWLCKNEAADVSPWALSLPKGTLLDATDRPVMSCMALVDFKAAPVTVGLTKLPVYTGPSVWQMVSLGKVFPYDCHEVWLRALDSVGACCEAQEWVHDTMNMLQRLATGTLGKGPFCKAALVMLEEFAVELHSHIQSVVSRGSTPVTYA